MMHVKNRFKVPPFLKHLTEKDVNHIDNLFPSCKTCNSWKTVFDLETFRDELEKQIKRLNSYSANYRMAKRYGLVEETEKPIVFYFETMDSDNDLYQRGCAGLGEEITDTGIVRERQKITT
jgi:hypothetical protein